MRVLNGYAGLGGNRKLWEDVEVIAVEKNEKIAEKYSELNPNDEIIIGDAHEYLINHFKEFDFIWMSPTCQSHSKMVKATRHDVVRYPDLALYQEIILLQNFFEGKWVVENVDPYYDPLVRPKVQLGRHLFWANFPISQFDVERPKDFVNLTNTEGAEKLKKWLGLEYEGNIYYEGNHCPAQVLRNCVHPEIGLHVLNCAREIIVKSDIRQLDFFE